MKIKSIILFIFICFFSFSIHTDAKAFDKQENVPIDKVWTITFNTEMDLPSLRRSLSIEQENGDATEVIISMNSENRYTVTPINPLPYDSEFNLIIGPKAMSKMGIYMNEITTIPFRTVEEPKVTNSYDAFYNSNEKKSLTETATDSFGTWNIYTNDDKQELDMEWNQGNEKIGGFTKTDGTVINGIAVGDSEESLIDKLVNETDRILINNTYYLMSDATQSFYLDEIDGYFVYYFIDIHDNDVSSIFWFKDKLDIKEYLITPPSITNKTKDAQERLMDYLIDTDRSKRQMNALTRDIVIDEVARLHSLDMAINDYFSHTNLDNISSFDRMRAENDSIMLGGENIAMGYYNSFFAHEALMNSIGHRNNILHDGYQEIGIGIEVNTSQRLYYTTNFFTEN